jgi:hypothetical protein
MTMSWPELIVLIVIAAVCGAVRGLLPEAFKAASLPLLRSVSSDR